MIVRPANKMLSAISFGVFWREAPSTSLIMRSRKVSPGFDVMRTLISSDRTRVPPVTAERSPPDSRMTGADSPVIADSSTEATPSMTSPSPGITSPGVHTTTSPDRRLLDATISILRMSAGLRSRLAWVCRRVRRSSSAWALPRPSAIASAKFANRTVNQSQSASWRMNPTSGAPRASSRSRTTVVNTLPTSTTNMTGFRTMWAGASLTNESRIARRTMGGSNSGRLVSAMLEEPPALHEQVFHDGAERPGREERQGAHDQDHANEQHHEERGSDRERTDRLRRNALLREKTRHREHRNLHREAADQRGKAEHRVVVVGRAGQARECTAVVGRRRREGIEDLGQTVRPGVVQALEADGQHDGQAGGHQDHQGEHEHVEHDHSHLAALYLLAEILRRSSHHQPRDEHRQQH